jgi:hypothetical protein
VSTFETICIILVVLPTAICAFITAHTPSADIWLLITIATFVVSCFLAGGALTLIDIARSTRALLEKACETPLASAPAAPDAPDAPAPSGWASGELTWAGKLGETPAPAPSAPAPAPARSWWKAPKSGGW